MVKVIDIGVVAMEAEMEGVREAMVTAADIQGVRECLK